MEVLSDDETPALNAVVQRISQLPMAERLKQAADLGETMVIAHAVVFAESGDDVIILIDDGEGARIATSEVVRLDRLRAQGRSVGSLKLVSTLTVLERAARTEHIPDRAALRDIYRRLRERDDGLVPIDQTGLLVESIWSPRP